MMKMADAVHFGMFTTGSGGAVEKAAGNPQLLELKEFPIKVVINTTNIRDSHKDVHLPGLWKKSIKENQYNYLIQEHNMTFQNIISDRVKVYTQQMTWKELGQKWDGMTEALIYEAVVEVDRNAFMAEQYAKGRVKNHSVGMRYVNLLLAMNSDSKYDQEEKAVWDKYIDQIVNREEVEEDSYFWAVLEAKNIEGSAVVRGSNFVTPVQSIGGEAPKSLDEADIITSAEPVTDWDAIAKALKQNKN